MPVFALFALLAPHSNASAQFTPDALTLAPEFAANLTAPGATAPGALDGGPGIDPEIVRLSLERPPRHPLGRRIGGRWLVTVGAGLMAGGTAIAATLGRHRCYNTGERFDSAIISGGLTAALGLAFTIGGGIRLARSSSGNQRHLWARRIGYALASMLFAATTSTVIFSGHIIKIIDCD